MIRKHLFTIFGLIYISVSSFGSHILGGQLWYEYINNGINNGAYKIHLDLYREMSGATLGSTQPITVFSTIGGVTVMNTSKTLTLAQSEYQLLSQNCGGSFLVGVNRYEAIISIPSYSSTKFSWELCCRPGGITGLNSSAGQGFYLEAKLNLENPNVRGFDNSVVPPNIGVLRMTSGIINQIATPYSESDGDSIYAVLKPAKQTATTNVDYATGYSFTNPLIADTLYPFTLGSELDGIHCLPTTNQVSVFSYRIDNYVIDTATNLPFRIGYITGDIPITVSQNSVANQSILISNQSPSSYNGTILTLNPPFYSNSITPNFSEFSLKYNSALVPNGISSVNYNVDGAGFVDSLIVLYDSTITSGMYQLQHNVGSDSTSLLGQCAQSTSDTLITIEIPFVSSQIIGNQIPYNSGIYKLSNSTKIDSVLWIVNGGVFSLSNDSILTVAPEDSVSAVFSNSNCNLFAIRYGKGTVDTLQITISAYGVGVTERIKPDLNVSPNPTNGVVSLNISVVGIYELISLDGRVLESGTAKKDYDFTNYPAGVYTLNLTTDEGIKVLKVVKN